MAKTFFRHHGTLGWWCGSFIKAVLHRLSRSENREYTMDDYQEELLEYQAFELDPLDPVDDATEL